MKFGSLFAGIGGFDLGLERAGMECIWQVEIDDFCNRVLEKHWPHVKRYRDVREVGRHNLEPVDLVCGGFPCQDLSSAGFRKGITIGERSSLYREMLRIISDIRPSYSIFENVSTLLTGGRGEWFHRFLSDLAAIGLDAEWQSIPAGGIGAPHERERTWVIAYPGEGRWRGSLFEGHIKIRRDLGKYIWSDRYLGGENPWVDWERNFTWKEFYGEPTISRKHDGVPDGAYRVGSLGNAVVPQIPEMIGRAIMEAHYAL